MKGKLKEQISEAKENENYVKDMYLKAKIAKVSLDEEVRERNWK